MKSVFLLTTFLLIASLVVAQDCNNIGQTPTTAFPVCGTSVFEQVSVPLCDTKPLYVPGCVSGVSQYSGKNPYWYTFTCFEAGTLGFTIVPKKPENDYDWQLYDITGHSPDDVFTTDPVLARSMIVTANWAGTYSSTGASAGGVSYIQCGSDPTDNLPTFAAMPMLILNHTYLLMISHFTDTQSGYDLSFGGGTAVITDTTPPALKSLRVDCAARQLYVKLNKKMRCNSLAANGSDFVLNTNQANIVAATPVGCTGFDMDSVIVTFDNALPPGTYTLSMKKGSDANTLLDICEKSIPEGSNLGFVITPKVPTLLDSIAPVHCAPQTLSLVFKKAIQCSTIAQDGSDFIIAGSYPVTIQSITTYCDGNNNTLTVDLNLSQPLTLQGDFTVTLRTGNDGNTIVDECGEVSPPSSVAFSVKDTVSAAFTYDIHYGCKQDTINFAQAGNNAVNLWKWQLDDAQQSTLQNPRGLYNAFDTKNIQCIATNGFCSDTTTQAVLLDNYLKVDFAVEPDVCPLEDVKFTDLAVGKNITRDWSFGDNSVNARDASPIHVYNRLQRTTDFKVQYSITDEYGCTQTMEKAITVYVSCIIDVPNAFTPNGDGINDILYPLNAVKAINLDFKVYNRWGQELYVTNDWKHGWDGSFKGTPQAPGMYVWVLSYDNKDTQKHYFKKGMVMLMR